MASGKVLRQRLELRLSRQIDQWQKSKGKREQLERMLAAAFLALRPIVRGKVDPVNVQFDVHKHVEEIIKYRASESFSPTFHAKAFMTNMIEKYRLIAVLSDPKTKSSRVRKRWVTQGDERVRSAHAEMEGVEIPANEAFDVDGYSMMHPGDDSLGAPDELIINCRCVLEYVGE